MIMSALLTWKSTGVYQCSILIILCRFEVVKRCIEKRAKKKESSYVPPSDEYLGLKFGDDPSSYDPDL